MSEFDVEAALRSLRGFPTKTLARRPDDQLSFVNEGELGGQALLLDTCVYIDRLQGKAPVLVKQIMDARHNNHSAICIQELGHTLGVLKPKDTRTPGVYRAVSEVIRSMPRHRILTPDADVLGRAAVLNGVLCRLQGYQNDQKLRCLYDCTLYLQASKSGLVLLTRNIADYDFCGQLFPGGKVLFYR
ncbi:type II toxin-antitoxin system VapC family toxin [Mesorhizobium sp. BH1-1-4]|uniref:type II toxin-antitoxin system VapC family toxin n=1 Tax=Mesorhizobium sp. BH1-1-4 TaxID=2876662 RepID=UPI001CD16177|nr:DNA-binding protein [Mesorhizobium sp. BH1-1-4]MBZ9994067.1 DNA-binding protein [Mesorhizobium sp. BH1-1-4]